MNTSASIRAFIGQYQNRLFQSVNVKKSSLILALIIFVLITLLPVFWVIPDSFIHETGISLKSYRGILTEKRQVGLLLNSLTLGLGTAFFSLIIGLPLAFLIARTDVYLKKYFRYLYLTPLIIPPHVSTVAWTYLLGSEGHLNLLAAKLFGSPFFNIYTLKGAILILTLSYFPIITLFAISGLNSTDQSLEEAGMICHPAFQVLKKITLPLIMPNILSGAIFVFILSLSDYGVPSLLRINTYPVEIFVRFSAFYDAKGAVALSLPLLLISLILIYLQGRYMKDRPYITLGSHTRAPRLIRLNHWQIPGTGFAALIILVAVILPVLTLVMESGSFTAWKVAFKTAHQQMISSLVLSASAATFGTGLSFFIAYILEKTPWLGKKVIDFLSFVPFVIPGAILGVGMIKIWNRPATDFIYQSGVIVVFAYMARFCPFSIKTVSANLRQIDTRLEEAAVLSDASWKRRLLHILLPLTKPGLLAGWAITFIFCMGELGTTLLVVPPGNATLSIRIYTLMHYGAGNLVACLCLVLMIITLLPVAVLVYLSFRNNNSLNASGNTAGK